MRDAPWEPHPDIKRRSAVSEEPAYHPESRAPSPESRVMDADVELPVTRSSRLSRSAGAAGSQRGPDARSPGRHAESDCWMHRLGRVLADSPPVDHRHVPDRGVAVVGAGAVRPVLDPDDRVLHVARAEVAGDRLPLWRYRVDADEIEIWSGVLWRQAVVVPRSRVQHIDVSQGPIERSYGLATLSIHTAGTQVFEGRSSRAWITRSR